MHFKKLFAPYILDRGYYYFIDKAVTGLKDKDGNWEKSVTQFEDFLTSYEIKNTLSLQKFIA